MPRQAEPREINDFIRDFQWAICPEGYEFRRTISEKQRTGERLYVAERKCSELVTRYPFKERLSLFRKFAAVTPNERGILKFARLNGLLGFLERDHVLDENGNWGSGTMGEPVQTWVDAINEMHESVVLWDAIRKNDTVSLASQLQSGYQRRAPIYPIAELWSRTQEVKEEALSNLDSPSAILCRAYAALQQTINHQLARSTSAMLLWETDKRKLAFHLLPRNLLGAMWYEFATEVSSPSELGTCERCGTPFELNSDRTRADRNFCSDTCKMAEYRKRKKAKQLYADGVSCLEIAKTIQRDVAIVERWIKASQKAK